MHHVSRRAHQVLSVYTWSASILYMHIMKYHNIANSLNPGHRFIHEPTFTYHTILGHFTFWISLPLTGFAMYTHRPQGVNYRVYLHVLKYLLLLYFGRSEWCRQIGLQMSDSDSFGQIFASLLVCITHFCSSIIIINICGHTNTPIIYSLWSTSKHSESAQRKTNPESETTHYISSFPHHMLINYHSKLRLTFSPSWTNDNKQQSVWHTQEQQRNIQLQHEM